jgi:hypothetical protein
MCCYYNGFAGHHGFGMFHGLGSIFGIVLIIVGILFAIKLVKEIFFGNTVKKV